MEENIILENFPATLEWLKKTKESYKFSGSYSRNHKFIDYEFCYRMWLVKQEAEDKTIKELHVTSWIKPPASRLEEGQIDFKEQIFEFTDQGLKDAADYLKNEIALHFNYLA